MRGSHLTLHAHAGLVSDCRRATGIFMLVQRRRSS